METLTWTTDKPTEPGFWWYRKHQTHAPSLLETYIALNRQLYTRFCDGSGSRYPVETFDGEWAGPLEPPR
jgi:hypothetical protein